MKIGKKTKVAREITRQEKNRRSSRRRWMGAGIGGLALFITLIIIQKYILNQEEKQNVYQVTKNIEVGTKITDENINEYLHLKEVQISLIPEGFVTDKEDIVGKFINRPYKVNDVLTIDGVTDTEKIYRDLIENPIEVSFNAADLSAAVGGIIREGDYINIYGLRKQSKESSASDQLFVVDADFTFKHVYVTKAFDGTGAEIETDSDKADESVSTLFNIILSERDIEQFNEMIKNCDIKVAKLLYNTDQDYQEFIQQSNENAGEFSIRDQQIDLEQVYDEDDIENSVTNEQNKLLSDEMENRDNEEEQQSDDSNNNQEEEQPVEQPVEEPVEEPVQEPVQTPTPENGEIPNLFTE